VTLDPTGAIRVAKAACAVVAHGCAVASALLLGPGAPEQAHTTDEHLEFAQLHTATKIYALLALDLAQHSPSPNALGEGTGG
jgi:acetylornithine deacetylase/succinyl-diaminopimelate desuccinylase-like protein